MMALSLWQPWATLVAIGAKRVETRDWSTDFRGKLAVHATKTEAAYARALVYESPFAEALAETFGVSIDADELPRGAIVAVATLDRVRPITAAGARLLERENPTEFAFGNYSLEDGQRYAWVFSDATPLPAPVECGASQKLWRVPSDIARQIAEQSLGAIT